MNTTTYHLTILNADGTQSGQFAPPTEMPSDLVPGEFVSIPDGNGLPQWYVFCDKQRWWGNGRWNVGGSISQFDPGSMTDLEMYELRRTLLKGCGWIS
ncbi:MAG: hypothetical protein RLZZ214_4258 [Verrucomicrobiota bacterium]|jgi:hypothetical protein